MQLNNLPFRKQVWSLITPYWRSSEKWIAWSLLLVVVALNYLTVEIAVFYSNWNREFFNLMQDKAWQLFWPMLGQFVLLMLVFMLVDLVEEYLRRTLRIRWRRWLTYAFIEQWMKDNNIYRHQLCSKDSDNPDQRITEDIKTFCDMTLSMGLGLLRTVTSLFSFIVILWGLSGILEFEFAGEQWHIPGYMVWVAIVYSVIGTWLTHKVARNLIPLNFNQEKVEADFRFHLMRVREHGESVVIQQGEQVEKKRARQLFGRIFDNWQQLTMMKMRYNALNSAYNEVARIFPYLVAAPRMMTGALQLGDMMQTATGFYRVQEAFSWFVDSYEEVAQWRAVTNRLITFSVNLEQLPDVTRFTESEQPQWQALTLHDPQQAPLLQSDAGTLAKHTMLVGASGAGKSTFFKLLAGIWPYFNGHISMPKKDLCMFIPQRPYLAYASLQQVLCYPANSDKYSANQCQQALADVGLNGLADELDKIDHWQARLSGGEAQKLMLARALLHQPKWLFLDESFSAIDKTAAASLYQLLKLRMPESHIIEINHHQQRQSMAKQLQLRDGNLVVEN
ncbi:ABC transporter ATP-binding protein/permease [Shewanella marina]|uniref:ABC transporter ATP-binding protein/permease n=1 Tax=Shewanella marina TaxID=487319 RepID=UPI0004714426|nr:ABC transporter ATP-binding protein/permease [Shewanella marina]